MKNYGIGRLWIVMVLFFATIHTGIAQNQKEKNNPSTKISYKVDFGPVYPIEGDSSQFQGKLSLDDTTGELKKLNFEVNLISFIGIHAGYLAWLGNSWYNPDMRFNSSSITKKDDHWEVNGTLEFRRRFAPLKINLYRRDVDGEMVLEGDFKMNTRDYFIGPLPIDLVPIWIPMKFTMVFDNPSELIKDGGGTTLNPS